MQRLAAIPSYPGRDRLVIKLALEKVVEPLKRKNEGLLVRGDDLCPVPLKDRPQTDLAQTNRESVHAILQDIRFVAIDAVYDGQNSASIQRCDLG
jgi:hypothetical protein